MGKIEDPRQKLTVVIDIKDCLIREIENPNEKDDVIKNQPNDSYIIVRA